MLPSLSLYSEILLSLVQVSLKHQLDSPKNYMPMLFIFYLLQLYSYMYIYSYSAKEISWIENLITISMRKIEDLTCTQGLHVATGVSYCQFK